MSLENVSNLERLAEMYDDVDAIGAELFRIDRSPSCEQVFVYGQLGDPTLGAKLAAASHAPGACGQQAARYACAVASSNPSPYSIVHHCFGGDETFEARIEILVYYRTWSSGQHRMVLAEDLLTVLDSHGVEELLLATVEDVLVEAGCAPEIVVAAAGLASRIRDARPSANDARLQFLAALQPAGCRRAAGFE